MRKTGIILLLLMAMMVGMAMGNVWSEWADFVYRECVKEARREKAPRVICENLQIAAEDFFTQHVSMFMQLMKKDGSYYDDLFERSMQPMNKMQGQSALTKVAQSAVKKRITSEKRMLVLFQKEVAQWFMNICTGKDAPTIGPSKTPSAQMPDLSTLPPEVRAQFAAAQH